MLEVITDRKLPIEGTGGAAGTVDYYLADVVSYSDYYPYGMLMPNRQGSVGDYRYGFQGQEMDDEIKGEGNSLNYTYRMHDPRIGRFFAVDPLDADYPMLTPYQFSSNNTVWYVEIEGLEGTVYQYKEWYEPLDNGGVQRRTEFIDKYTREDLDGDVNKYYRKDFDSPNSETIMTGYAARNDDGSRGGLIIYFQPDSPDFPKSGEDLNESLGLTKVKIDKQQEARRKLEADRKKDAPLAARIFVKVFPPTAIADALNTIFTGEEGTQYNVEVEGVYNRYISPGITLGTGGFGFGRPLPFLVQAVDYLNTGIGVEEVIREEVTRPEPETIEKPVEDK